MLWILIVVILVLSQFVLSKQPPVSGNWISNAYSIGLKSGSLWDKVVKLSEKCTKNGGLLLYLPYFYVVTDPEVLQSVLNSTLEKGVFFRFWEPWLGGGLVMARVPIWKVHRKLLNPAFNQHLLDEVLPMFNEQARRLVQRWIAREERTFDPVPDLAMFNLDTVCMTLFGFKEKEEVLSSYIEAIQDLNAVVRHRFERFWLFSDLVYRWTPSQKQENQCLEIIHGLSHKIIKNRKEVTKNIPPTDAEAKELTELNKKLFIDLLLDLESSGAYTASQLRAEIDTFLFGGHDSAAITSSYTLVLLGSHPDVQEKVYQEIKQVVGDTKEVQKEDLNLNKLVYLEAVIKESMRLYPFAPFTQRYVDDSIKLKDYTIPRGSTLFILFYGTHRHPVWGPDAHEFRPERWLQPGSLPDSPAAFLGFSWGKRSYIGKPYAMMLLKTTLMHLLRNFKVKADHTKLKFELDVVLKPVAGNTVHFERRL